MRYSNQSQYLLGDTTPAATFGRVGRTIQAPHLRMPAMAESANEATLVAHPGTPAIARSAPAPSSFANRAVNADANRAALDAQALQAAARAHSMRLAGNVAARVVRAVTARLKTWREAYRRNTDARATYLALAELDTRTLHDLGINRSELKFVAHRLARGEALDERRGLR